MDISGLSIRTVIYGKRSWNTMQRLVTVFLFFQVLGAELAILDEIDSGLDVDALQDVAKAVNGLLTPKNSVLMITHYQRLLDYIKPTLIHIMVSIVAKPAFFTSPQRSYWLGLFSQNPRFTSMYFFCIGGSCMLLGFRRMEESLKPETSPWPSYLKKKATKPYPASYITCLPSLRGQSVIFMRQRQWKLKLVIGKSNLSLQS